MKYQKLISSGKKSFLEHVYGTEKGPDADLIMMLEKDVVSFVIIKFS